MRPLLLALVCLSVVALPLGARLTYGGYVPSGEAVRAVEARVALPAAKLGANRVASWSLIWPGAEIVLTFDSRNFLEGVDEPRARLTCSGSDAEIRGDLDFSGGPNTVSVEWNADGTATILAGERQLRRVLTVDSLPYPVDSISVRGEEADVVDLIVESDSDDFGRLLTAYSADELRAAPCWRYLDRENDPAFALPGGSYELAAIAAPGGAVDLIYLGGAQTNADRWRPGMLKGRMTPTGFRDYYRLTWYDATGRRLPDEAFATTDSSVLTLTFPALQATLRFALIK